VLDTLGLPADAIHARTRARALLLARAARISDPAMRHSFLTNVAVHADIMRAYE
jgi:hypothetical protein